MRLALSIGVMATAMLAPGCAVGPHAGGRSVTHDVAGYLQREWPLAGPPVIPPDACQGSCSCCGGGGGSCGGGAAPEVWEDDWDQPGCLPNARGYTDDPPPAVPLEAGSPGRFFPVPTREPFAPQGPSAVGFGPMAKAAG